MIETRDEMTAGELLASLVIARDLRTAAETMTTDEARFLVDDYYAIQKLRIRAGNQVRAMKGEPCGILNWNYRAMSTCENQIKAALDRYSRSDPLGQWARAHVGIGPVLAAGLLAHISFEVNGQRIRTPSAIWRYAGLDPTIAWSRGQKRPFNGALKTLCWKMGESFVKVSGREDAVFGRLYRERKAIEVAKNAAGEFAEQARRIVAKVPKHAQAATYRGGKLPDGHLHMRAKRWTVKMFLSCYWRRGVEILYGETPALPYAIAHLGHADLFEA